MIMICLALLSIWRISTVCCTCFFGLLLVLFCFADYQATTRTPSAEDFEPLLSGTPQSSPISFRSGFSFLGFALMAVITCMGLESQLGGWSSRSNVIIARRTACVVVASQGMFLCYPLWRDAIVTRTTTTSRPLIGTLGPQTAVVDLRSGFELHSGALFGFTFVDSLHFRLCVLAYAVGCAGMGALLVVDSILQMPIEAWRLGQFSAHQIEIYVHHVLGMVACASMFWDLYQLETPNFPGLPNTSSRPNSGSSTSFCDHILPGDGLFAIIVPTFAGDAVSFFRSLAYAIELLLRQLEKGAKAGDERCVRFVTSMLFCNRFIFVSELSTVPLSERNLLKHDDLLLVDPASGSAHRNHSHTHLAEKTCSGVSDSVEKTRFVKKAGLGRGTMASAGVESEGRHGTSLEGKAKPSPPAHHHHIEDVPRCLAPYFRLLVDVVFAICFTVARIFPAPFALRAGNELHEGGKIGPVLWACFVGFVLLNAYWFRIILAAVWDLVVPGGAKTEPVGRGCIAQELERS